MSRTSNRKTRLKNRQSKKLLYLKKETKSVNEQKTLKKIFT